MCFFENIILLKMVRSKPPRFSDDLCNFDGYQALFLRFGKTNGCTIGVVGVGCCGCGLLILLMFQTAIFVFASNF